MKQLQWASDLGRLASSDLIAVLDIGKTNARIFLIEAQSGEIIWTSQRPNKLIATSPVRQLDVRGIETWLMRELVAAPHKQRIRRIVPIAHGAAAVLIDRSGNVLLAPDYEDPIYETTREEYARERDDFECTFSPHLPLGLNLGAQLHFLESEHAEIFGQVASILLLPQFVAWRFSGVMASEVTSLGCHSDLWRPLDRSFSALVIRRGWDALLPARRNASDLLGPISAEMAGAVGFKQACRIVCGMHDSNASYLSHWCQRDPGRPFAIVSSGTWTIAMASDVDMGRLQQARDMLANVDAFGSPVGTARFMGGREYQAIAGNHGTPAIPTKTALGRIVERRTMALPSFAKAGGPFQDREGRLINADGLDALERAALATVYLALVTDIMLDLLGASGDLVIDGPLAGNPLFGPLMSAFRPGSPVRLADSSTGPARGGLALATGATRRPTSCADSVVEPLAIEGLLDYRTAWRKRVLP